MVEAVAEANATEQVDSALADIALLAQFEWDHGIFECAKGGDQLEVLEEKPTFSLRRRAR